MRRCRADRPVGPKPPDLEKIQVFYRFFKTQKEILKASSNTWECACLVANDPVTQTPLRRWGNDSSSLPGSYARGSTAATAQHFATMCNTSQHFATLCNTSHASDARCQRVRFVKIGNTMPHRPFRRVCFANLTDVALQWRLLRLHHVQGQST